MKQSLAIHFKNRYLRPSNFQIRFKTDILFTALNYQRGGCDERDMKYAWERCEMNTDNLIGKHEDK
jgi:hypothetical protein